MKLLRFFELWRVFFWPHHIVQKKFTEIIAALEQLLAVEENVDTRLEAGVVLLAISCFPFIFFLNLWNALLPEINDAQKYSQTKGYA